VLHLAAIPLVFLCPWITRERSTLPPYDDVIEVLRASEEGMPFLWFEWLIAPIFYRFNLHSSERVQRLAQ